jgi:hypothetical protein
MTADIVKEILESLLLIPTEQGRCPLSPIIKVERKLSFEEMEVHEKEGYETTCEASGLNAISPIENLTLKQILVRKDFDLLGELVATNYYSRIRKQNPAWSDLYQVVEIDWSLRDLQPAEEGAIHYEVFTKRDIFIRIEDDK